MVRLKNTETKQIFFGSCSILFDPFFFLFVLHDMKKTKTWTLQLIKMLQGYQHCARFPKPRQILFTTLWFDLRFLDPFYWKRLNKQKKNQQQLILDHPLLNLLKCKVINYQTQVSKYFMSIIIMMMTSLIRNNKFWLIVSISTGGYMSIEIDHWKASW